MTSSRAPTVVLGVLSLAVMACALFLQYAFAVIEKVQIPQHTDPNRVWTVIAKAEDLAPLKRTCLKLAQHIDTETQWSVQTMADARNIAGLGAKLALAAGTVSLLTLLWVVTILRRSEP